MTTTEPIFHSGAPILFQSGVVELDGNAYANEHGVLMVAPVYLDGTIPEYDSDDWCEAMPSDEPEVMAMQAKAAELLGIEDDGVTGDTAFLAAHPMRL